MTRCSCGKTARIQFMEHPKCWDCYHYLQIKMGTEDWRDELIHEKQIEYGLLPQPNEPDWALAERAKKVLKKMGGLGKAMANKGGNNDKNEARYTPAGE